MNQGWEELHGGTPTNCDPLLSLPLADALHYKALPPAGQSAPLRAPPPADFSWLKASG